MAVYLYAYVREDTQEIAVGYARAPVPSTAAAGDLALCVELEPPPELTDVQVMEACAHLRLSLF